MKCQIPQISWHSRDPVLSIDFQPVSGEHFRLASGGTDSHVLIWYVVYDEHKTVKIECASDLYRHNKSVNVVRFSPNGDFLASGDDEGAVFVWQMKEKDGIEAPNDDDCVNKEDWYPVKLLRGHLEDIYDLSWSKDSNFLVSASMDNSAILWDMQKFVKLHIFSDFKGYVQGVSWDPCNQFIASLGSDRTLRIHNINSKRCVSRVSKAPWSNSTEKGTVKPRLFYDDTLKSYCRRLSYTPDGELLIAPSGIVEKGEKLTNACYVFSRHVPNKPILTLPTGDWYTVAVRCNPHLYKLRREANENTDLDKETSKSMINLPYRMVFAVGACDSVLMYDTEQLLPFACISNIHYTHLTDLAWSPDGLTLIASSTDGYCSFIIFSKEELGEIYVPDDTKDMETDNVLDAASSPQDNALKCNATKSSSISKDVSLANDDLENMKTPSIPEKKLDKKSPKMPSIKKFLVSPITAAETQNSVKSNIQEKVFKDNAAKTEPDVITLSDTPIKQSEAVTNEQRSQVSVMNQDEAKPTETDENRAGNIESCDKSTKCKMRLDFSDKSETETATECAPPKKFPKMSIKRFFISGKAKKPVNSQTKETALKNADSLVDKDVVSLEVLPNQHAAKGMINADIGGKSAQTAPCEDKPVPDALAKPVVSNTNEAESAMDTDLMESDVLAEKMIDVPGKDKHIFKAAIDEKTFDLANSTENSKSFINQDKPDVQMNDLPEQSVIDQNMEVDVAGKDLKGHDQSVSDSKNEAETATGSSEPAVVRNFDENASDGSNSVPISEVNKMSFLKESENDWKLELSQDDEGMEVSTASSEMKPPEPKTTPKRRIPLITLSSSIASRK